MGFRSGADSHAILQTGLYTACRSVRVNHVGIAISRHERRDGPLYAIQSTETWRRSPTAGTQKPAGPAKESAGERMWEAVAGADDPRRLASVASLVWLLGR